MSNAALLVRLDSKARSLEDEIKASERRFDVAIVFKLSLANKGLPAIPNLGACINLLDLNLSGNNISRIEGLETLPQLKRLNLASNRISKLEGLSHLTKLESLALHDNRLDTLSSLRLTDELRPLLALRALYVQQLTAERPLANACCQVQGYKAAVLAALPLLTNLDGERNPANSNYAELSREMGAAVQSPAVRPEPELPAVAPWLDVSLTQPDEDWPPLPTDPQVEKHKQSLVKALDACHMLMEVFAREVVQTRGILDLPQPG